MTANEPTREEAMSGEKDRYEASGDGSDADARDINDMLNEMREMYHDAFGKFPTEAQEEKFLHEHPGALDVYRSTKAAGGAS